MAAHLSEKKKNLKSDGAAPNYIRDIYIVKSKKGDDYVYAWKGGPRILGEPGSEESIAAWRAEIAKKKFGEEGTLGGLIALYKASPKWNGVGRKALSAKTKQNYEFWFGRIIPKFGAVPFVAAEDPDFREKIIEWRDSYALQPRTADMGVQTLRALLSFGVDRRKLCTNQALGIEKLYESDRSGLIWRPRDMAVLQKTATVAIWKAAKLASLTGLRQSDLLGLPWSGLDDDAVELTTKKSRGRSRAMIVRHPALDAFLEAQETDLIALAATLPEDAPLPLTVLLTTHGKPWGSGFNASWRRAKKAALKTITDPAHREYFSKLHFHDLRGTAATELYAAGLSKSQIALFLGWQESAVDELLKRYVDRKTVAKKVNERLQEAFDAARQGKKSEAEKGLDSEGMEKTKEKNRPSSDWENGG